MGVMKMGNIVPSAGIKPTSLTFWAIVIPLHHISFPDVTTIPMHTCLYMQLLASEVSGDYNTLPPGIISLFMFTNKYIQAMALHIHTQRRFNNQRAHSLYRITVTPSSVMGVMKMGNTVPRAGILGQCATVTLCRLPDVTTIPHLPLCAAPCLRGQWRLLEYYVYSMCTHI